MRQLTWWKEDGPQTRPPNELRRWGRYLGMVVCSTVIAYGLSGGSVQAQEEEPDSETSIVVTAETIEDVAQRMGLTVEEVQAKIKEKMQVQITALQAQKALLTPTQKKIDSQLIAEEKRRRGVQVAAGINQARSFISVDSDGKTEVDITVTKVKPVLRQIKRLGGTVLFSSSTYNSIRAVMPLTQMEDLAKIKQVRFIRPALEAQVRAASLSAINVTEGDRAHEADVARATYGVDGSGITVGVISNGVDGLANAINSGDLPSDVTVLSGQAGSGNEGVAMLEIVHDLAPGANLLFATASPSQEAMATNIQALRNAGADIIVDDVGYLDVPVFQDGIISQAVEDVIADGALYLTAVGNDGHPGSPFFGVWENNFQELDSVYPANAFHRFTSDNVLLAHFNMLQRSTPAMTLHWSDPWGASSNDYDLYLYEEIEYVQNPGGTDIIVTLAGFSINVQDGDDIPFEGLGNPNNIDLTDWNLVITKKIDAVNQTVDAEDRYLRLFAPGSLLTYAHGGTIYGHVDAPGAIAVGAVDVGQANGGKFSDIDPEDLDIEDFSSAGWRFKYFDENGELLNPEGGYLHPGGVITYGPEIVGADRVSTSAPGFNPFLGTSAAAPHAAGIAALLWSARPEAGAVHVRAVLLTQSTKVLDDVGWNYLSGYGLPNAEEGTDTIIRAYLNPFISSIITDLILQ